MTIALAQMDVIPGQPRANVDKMISLIQEAKQKNVDLIFIQSLFLDKILRRVVVIGAITVGYSIIQINKKPCPTINKKLNK